VACCLPAAQDEVLRSLLSQLPAVEVEDLPGLVKYLVSSAGRTVVEEVRGLPGSAPAVC